MFSKIFTKTKNYLNSSNYSKKANYYDKRKNLAVGKIKVET